MASQVDVGRKRLYVGGLSSSTTEAELRQRFASFGTVNSVEIMKDKYTNESRNFGYLDLGVTEQNWMKCLSILNGASWKGSKLKVQEAKPNFEERVQQEKLLPEKPIVKKRIPKKRNSENMELITEENMSLHRGWRKGKFGRPMAVFKCYLKYNPKKFLVYDPTKLKNHIKRINTDVPELPVSQLTWSVDSSNSVPQHQYQYQYQQQQNDRQQDKKQQKQLEQSQKDQQQKQQKKLEQKEQKLQQKQIQEEEKQEEKLENQKNQQQQILNNDPISKKKESEIKRLESLKKKEEIRKQQSLSIQTALQKVEQFTSTPGSQQKLEEDKEDHEMEEKDEENDMKGPNSELANNWLGSDDDENDEPEANFRISEAFEGEKGDKLMKLQLKYGTDSRFKLDDRFKDDFDEDEEEEEESKKSSTLQDPNLDNLKKELEVDKGSALKVLGSLFPDKKTHTEKTLWKEVSFFDPDNPDSMKLEITREPSQIEDNKVDKIQSKVEKKTIQEILKEREKEKEKEEKEKQKNEDPNLQKKFFSMESTYHDLFRTPGASNFSILGDVETEPEVSETLNQPTKIYFGSPEDRPKPKELPKPIVPHKPIEKYSFFFHFDSPQIKGSATRIKTDEKFMRTNTIEEITKKWEENRQGLTQEFKRKHKSTSRKKTKLQRNKKIQKTK